MEIISTGNNNGVQLDEYKGSYSLSSHRESQGKWYATWAKYKKNKSEYQEKDWPVKVAIGGTKEEAIETLKLLLKELGEDAPF